MDSLFFFPCELGFCCRVNYKKIKIEVVVIKLVLTFKTYVAPAQIISHLVLYICRHIVAPEMIIIGQNMA